MLRYTSLLVSLVLLIDHLPGRLHQSNGPEDGPKRILTVSS
jgi:hypothetical protein